MELTLTSEATGAIASRSAVYRLLSQGFAFPTEAFHRAVRDGAFVSEMQEAVKSLPYSLAIGGLGKGTKLGYDEFQSTYLGLFELGGPNGAALPLWEGHYGGGLLRDMEEVLRFYHHFGFRYTGGFRPDHLQTELEFMHALTFGEAAAVESGRDVSIYRQAQRDFVEYHLTPLISRVTEGLKGRGSAFYPELAGVLGSFVSQEARGAA